MDSNQKEHHGKQFLFKSDNDKMVSQVQQRQRQLGIKEMVKKIINSQNCQLKNQNVSKKFEKEDQYQNEDNSSSKLAKRKLIKKVNFQRFYDTKMNEHLKQTQKRWQTFASNLKTQHKQILNKFTNSLKLKQEIIQRQKSIIKEQSNKITQLNNLINEKKASPFSVLKKIQDLQKQVKEFIVEHANEEAQKLKIKTKFNSYYTQTETVSQKIKKFNKQTQSEVNQCYDKDHWKLKYDLEKSYDMQLQLRRQLGEQRQKSSNYQFSRVVNTNHPIPKLKSDLEKILELNLRDIKKLQQQVTNKNMQIEQIQKKISIANNRAQKQIRRYEQFILQLALDHYKYKQSISQINQNANQKKSQLFQQLMNEILEKNQMDFQQFKISKTRQQLNQQIIKLNDKILTQVKYKQQLEVAYSKMMDQKRVVAQALKLSEMARSKLKTTVKQLEVQIQNYKKQLQSKKIL